MEECSTHQPTKTHIQIHIHNNIWKVLNQNINKSYFLAEVKKRILVGWSWPNSGDSRCFSLPVSNWVTDGMDTQREQVEKVALLPCFATKAASVTGKAGLSRPSISQSEMTESTCQVVVTPTKAALHKQLHNRTGKTGTFILATQLELALCREEKMKGAAFQNTMGLSSATCIRAIQ